MEGYIGQIIMFAGNFAPRGWAFCHGQFLSIAQNTALFAILGTTYGGNGQTTFALPDFRGRVPVGGGQGPGLANVNLGEQGGSANVTLTPSQMPAHSHQLAASDLPAEKRGPEGRFLARNYPGVPERIFSYHSTANTALNPAAIGVAGGSQPFPVMQPYLGMNFVICIEGIFPSRN